MMGTKGKYFIFSKKNQDRIIHIIKKLIHFKHYKILGQLLYSIHPKNLSHIWDVFNDTEKESILSCLDQNIIGELIVELEVDSIVEIFKNKNVKWIVNRLNKLEASHTVDILKSLSQQEANFIIKNFNSQYSQQIQDLMNYPEKTAGALMTSNFIVVNQNATVKSIIKKIQLLYKKESLDKLHFIYVVNKQNQLKGYLPLKRLLFEPSYKQVKTIFKKTLAYTYPEKNQEEVAQIFKDYDLITLPVINHQEQIIGKINIDDIIDVIEEEASEDVYKMFGLKSDANIRKNIWFSFKDRFPWLFINFITTSLSILVISFYEPIIQQYTPLAIFMPLIAALGGASGNQMVAIIVRALAISTLHRTQIFRLIFKESGSIFLIATLIGLLSSISSYIIYYDYTLSILLFFSIFIVMFLATLIGITIPLLLKSLKFDPAMGSSIIVATFVDALSFFIFLYLASLVLF